MKVCLQDREACKIEYIIIIILIFLAYVPTTSSYTPCLEECSDDLYYCDGPPTTNIQCVHKYSGVCSSGSCLYTFTGNVDNSNCCPDRSARCVSNECKRQTSGICNGANTCWYTDTVVADSSCCSEGFTCRRGECRARTIAPITTTTIPPPPSAPAPTNPSTGSGPNLHDVYDGDVIRIRVLNVGCRSSYTGSLTGNIGGWHATRDDSVDWIFKAQGYDKNGFRESWECDQWTGFLCSNCENDDCTRFDRYGRSLGLWIAV